jgi:hypothetical protein
MALLNIDTKENRQMAYSQWVKDAIEKEDNIYEPEWSRSIAVGDKPFVENIKKALGPKARY